MTTHKALSFIEIDLGICALAYGVSPCTASVGVTGARKCFNSLADCQDEENYDEMTVTLRFAKAASHLVESGIEAIPSVASIDFSPPVLAPGEDLGTRASIRITFNDHPHSDTGPGFDKYHAERDYDPYGQGSFWGRFRARFPFLKGERLRWRQGFVGQTLEEMETRHFLVEGFDGPTPEGTFAIIAKDPLRVLEGKRSNAPAASRGALLASIDASTTSAQLTPTGIGNAEYPAAGHLNIGGKEVVGFTRSGDNLTITRGQQNTDGVAHSANERCQLVLSYAAADPADIIYDLMVNYGGLDPAWIALDDWQDETGSFLRRLYTTDIAEPTSVNQLVTELVEQCGLNIWWDDLGQKVRLQVLRQIDAGAAVLDDRVIMKRTFRSAEQQGKRISQVWTFFAQTNPLKNLEDRDNYRQVEVTVNLDNEEKYGQPAIKKIWSRWIPLGGGNTALRTNEILLGRYLTPPRRFGFSLFRGAQDAPRLGGGYLVEARTLQDATGAREQVPVQCVSLRPSPDSWAGDYEEMRFVSLDLGDLADRVIVLSGDVYRSVDLRSLHDTLYPAPVHGDGVIVYVQDGATVGSNSTGTPALDIGDTSNWPIIAGNGTRTNASAVITGLVSTADLAPGMFVRGTGIPNGTKILTVDSGSQITLTANATSSGTSTVTVYTVRIAVHLRGRIGGRGGPGGRGANGAGDIDGTDGGAGGTALRVRYPIDLYLDQGEADLWGGGGGGAGGSCAFFDDHRGGGGGGGAGTPPGPGGEGPGPGEEGKDGTSSAGGAGGRSYTSSAFWVAPSLQSTVRGGNGGAAGQNGGDDIGNYQVPGGAPGSAGAALDGLSWVRKIGSGDIRGSQIN